MLDIDRIKWGCEFAEGFSWEYEPFDYTDTSFVLVYYAKERYKRDEKTGKIKTSIYKLFLQEVIEAINREDLKYYIEVCKSVTVVNSEDGADFRIFSPTKDHTIDQCKELAIIWVMDHIKEKV